MSSESPATGTFPADYGFPDTLGMPVQPRKRDVHTEKTGHTTNQQTSTAGYGRPRRSR